MDRSSADFLLRLVRIALGDAADLSVPSGLDWKGVVGLAFRQGVAAIAVDGLQRIYELAPEQETGIESDGLAGLRYGWFGSVFQAEEGYSKYSSDLASLARYLSAAGIETMVLKGYGLSLNYPVPSHRPTGDIDVYFADKWQEADRKIEEKGVKVDYSHHHHSVFNWNGQMVENHYDIENRYASRRGRVEDDMLKTIASRGVRRVNVDGAMIALPSATFNGVFLLSHTASHFASDHITLRHLLDWALFVDRESEGIDWPFVVEWHTRMGQRRFLDCMNALSIGCLGIPAEKFPPLERDYVLEQRVLEDILQPAFNEKGSGFFFKLRRLKANMWKRNLVTSEPLVPRMVRLGWSHLLRPGELVRRKRK